MAKYQCLLILSLVVLASVASANQFKVGGSDGWKVPSDPKEYSQWAHKNRFRIGDSLLFVYQPNADSVLLVNETQYNNCDTSTYINAYHDGRSIYVFTHSGPHYFISGNRYNCLKNETLHVVVLADRSSSKAPAPSTNNSPPSDGGSNSSSNAATSTDAMSFIPFFGTLIGSLFFMV